jgi:two-component system, NarL family, invasion response regulator UvrY
MISVALASRLLVVREGMKRILLPLQDIEVVAEVKGLDELISVEASSAAQVAVVANPPTTDGQDFLVRFKAACPRVQVIVVTRSPTLPEILAALRHGARGLLSTSCTANHLPAAIRAVSSGRIYMHENVSHIVAADLNGLARDHTHKALTQRELEIFMKLAEGWRVTEIASQLGISVKTVSTHKGRMMEKMGISSFSQLVQYAIAHGLFDGVNHHI